MEKYFVTFLTRVYEDPSNPEIFFDRARSGIIAPTKDTHLVLTEEEINNVITFTIQQTLDREIPNEVLLQVVYKHPLSGPL